MALAAYTWTYLHIYLYMHTHTYIYIYIYVYIYRSMYICIYKYVYIYIYIRCSCQPTRSRVRCFLCSTVPRAMNCFWAWLWLGGAPNKGTIQKALERDSLSAPLGIPPRVKQCRSSYTGLFRSSYTGLYPQSASNSLAAHQAFHHHDRAFSC